MMDFQKRYDKLNAAQKLAVDSIDGPVMVIAGPGTGKTELLSVRAANILRLTDTLPENILCLTFTESGADEMRKRLTTIIGKDAYKIAVHTFHSFGSEIINQNGKYFYNSAHYRPADELSSYQIISDIFSKLPHSSPIASKNNGEFTLIHEIRTIISEMKKSGLTSDELSLIFDENDKVIDAVEKHLTPIFDAGIKKGITAEKCAEHIEDIRQINDKVIISTTVRLSTVIADSLAEASSDAIESNSTKPITAWRDKWFTKNDRKQFVLKSRERQIKLRAICDVYNQYLLKMQTAELYDFDDMILRAVGAMEIFDDLRYNLQEKYQYIMVDEFQDTNMAQMRILHNLTNNEASNGRPNMLVVGDDDQAIYSFQGADISNIFDFRSKFPSAQIISLTDNYRSTPEILSGSRNVILQGIDRLENRLENVDKNLVAHSDSNEFSLSLRSAESISAERHFIATSIKSQIDAGKKPCDIAILTRQHRDINAILPYLYHSGISVNYERRDNVLDQPPIILIEQLSQLLLDISAGRHSEANAVMPQILAHPQWGITPLEIWQLSIDAYDNHKRWLDVLSESTKFAPIFNWFITTAALVNDTPLEQMLDIIIGKQHKSDSESAEFVSPFYDYFFSATKLANNPNEYLIHLEALRTIRSKAREYRPDQTPTLATFIEFITLNRKIGSTISAIRNSIQTDDAINVMTVHKSKGLEFDTVYVVGATDSVWGAGGRGRSRQISYPENLPLAPAGETDDERLRLFYVAITRAKQQLNISYAESDSNGKKTQSAAFLVGSDWSPQPIDSSIDTEQLTESAELGWYQPLIEPTTKKMRDLLQPKLLDYKLSVTHLNNFLDVANGGPATFLMQNLLHFPTAKSASAAFGTAIHNTIQLVHTQFSATGKKQDIAEILQTYESNLQSQHLPKPDFERFLQKGIDTLQAFFAAKYDSFQQSQIVEQNFGSQQCIVGSAHLAGNLDLIDIDKSSKLITVTDYKTGKPAYDWKGSTDYEKIKLHKYKQQLLFYKLLVENARDYRGYLVANEIMQFVEPTKSGDILSIDAQFDDAEIERFTQLINAVWTHIIEFNLPDVSGYDQSLKGILNFEQDLIDGKI